jgi:hypothetical protein
MTTVRQIEANRKNAKSSTGPQSDAGKTASRMNALRHGLTAETLLLLPGEDESEFTAFRDAQLEDLAPVGALEEQLAAEIVDLGWRLRRASRLEHGVLAYGVACVDEQFYSASKRAMEVTNADVAIAAAAQLGGPLEEVIAVTNEDAYELVTESIDDATDVKRSEQGRLANAFINDAAGPNAITKLIRHETSLFRRRNQAFATYAGIQQARTANDGEETA